MKQKKHKQHILVSVTNDLTCDQRVNKMCLTLMNYFPESKITLIGRELNTSLKLNTRKYQTHRLKLFFEKGFLFYAEFNIRLFFFLLFTKNNILVSNDLDTLLPNYLVSKIKKSKLIYDSHEYFCQVPELINRPLVQKVWKSIENFILPRLTFLITVSESISKKYEEEYQIQTYTIKNLPLKIDTGNKNRFKSDLYKKLDIPSNIKLIIYQGAVNVDRGIEELILAMKEVENAKLLLIGRGDIFDAVKNLISLHALNEKIHVLGSIPFEDLPYYTLAADLGVSLEKDSNLNYRYSLPNKIFDYIQAEIPVLASKLPETEKIIYTYQVGELALNHNPSELASKINFMLHDPIRNMEWNKNLRQAKEDLCWENQHKKLVDIFNLHLA